MKDMPQLEVLTDTFELSAQENLIPLFKQHIAEAGLVGEENNAAVVLLTAISCKLIHPLNLTIYGESSAGKNYLMEKVCDFLPDEMKKTMTGMTPKVLMHAGREEFKHKVVLIAEYEGVKGADYAIRTFQSEGSIRWDFVNTKKGVKKESNEVEGPAAFIQATTRSVLHPENETRLLSVHVDESPAQTRAIVLGQAQRAASGQWRQPTQHGPIWHKFIRSLKVMNVRIPFAEKVAEFFPMERVRTRRDFPKFLGMIESSALLHQSQRNNEEDGIVASVKDYEIARELYLHCYAASPDKRLEDLLKIAQELSHDGGVFKVSALQERSGWGKTTVYELVARAEESGALAEGDNRGEYRFIRATQLPPLELPTTL